MYVWALHVTYLVRNSFLGFILSYSISVQSLLKKESWKVMKGCFVVRQSGNDGRHREACKAAHLCGGGDEGLAGQGRGHRVVLSGPSVIILTPFPMNTL